MGRFFLFCFFYKSRKARMFSVLLTFSLCRGHFMSPNVPDLESSRERDPRTTLHVLPSAPYGHWAVRQCTFTCSQHFTTTGPMAASQYLTHDTNMRS